MRKRRMAGFALLLCAVMLWFGCGGSAEAAKQPGKTDTLSGDVSLLKQDNGNYIMQVTVQNDGEDFSGTVQVIFAGNGFQNCAYHTEITLPAQGKKQFTITVTERAADIVRGICALNFLDQRGRTLQSIQLKGVFGSNVNGISVGILSDSYADLTWMDAGGEEFYIRGVMSYPLNLIKLRADHLREQLKGMYFLVIDRFNMASLDEEDVLAIQEWVEAGGWLLIGTGAYAEETLAGFSEDFLALNILEVSEPGKDNHAAQEMANYGYYYNFQNVDFTRMAVASLEYTSQHAYTESRENPGILCEVGDGAVGVFFVSFGDPEMRKVENYVAQRLFQEVMYTSNSYRINDDFGDLQYIGQRALAYIDSRQTNVDFTWLEVLIGAYVVLAGPLLYLILRKCRKSEWYWVAVPVTGLIFIGCVFFFGRDARVVEPKVYSVTVQQAESARKDTYFLAYQGGVKPWELLLDESYDVAGPGLNGYVYWNNSSNVSEYVYTVREGGEGLFMGVKPTENFESGYLYAGGRAERKGSLRGVGLSHDGLDIKGEVCNETAFDLDYLAVWHGSYIMVFSDVKAGERIDLEKAAQAGRCVYQDTVHYYNELMSSMVTAYWTRSSLPYDQTTMAALLVGLGAAKSAQQQDDLAVIAGIMKNYDRAVAGRCSEVSYGCFYSYGDVENSSWESDILY